MGGRAGILHGSRSAVMQDEEGQILEAHSVSAGLDYPGAGPQHAFLRDSGRARYVAVTDREAVEAFKLVARLEGIIPALETAHALAWVLAQHDGELDLVCLSGRGDKDLAEVLGRRVSDERRSSERGSSASPRPFAAHAEARGADALSDGRLSDARAVGADRRGLRAGGRRPDRARRALLGPAGRRPGDPRGGHARAGRGGERGGRAGGGARAGARACRWC